MSRKNIQVADALSKIPDHDDWEVTPQFFEEPSVLWGPFDVDRLADPGNSKLPRFKSKFSAQGRSRSMLFRPPGQVVLIF